MENSELNKLGQKLEIYTVVDYIGKGFPIILPNGAKIIRTILEDRTDIKYIPDLAFPISKEVLKYYQPKLPEHSIVLSGKQCAEIIQDNYNIGYERGSKETAEKIYKEYLCDIFSLEAKKEFAKQFGIKVKE